MTVRLSMRLCELVWLQEILKVARPSPGPMS